MLRHGIPRLLALAPRATPVARHLTQPLEDLGARDHHGAALGEGEQSGRHIKQPPLGQLRAVVVVGSGSGVVVAARRRTHLAASVLGRLLGRVERRGALDWPRRVAWIVKGTARRRRPAEVGDLHRLDAGACAGLGAVAALRQRNMLDLMAAPRPAWGALAVPHCAAFEQPRKLPSNKASARRLEPNDECARRLWNCLDLGARAIRARLGTFFGEFVPAMSARKDAPST